jgi:CRISPR/Cas system CSM-associated protein Csm3 (group 7 of RAMP superfamily)
MPEQEANTQQQQGRPRHRRVVERVIVRGRLVLESPASFGNGDVATWTDLPLLLDETDDSPLLTGASIAGALRAYLRERQTGYERPAPESAADRRAGDERDLLATRLFGGFSGDEDGEQSAVLVHDAPGRPKDYELRDGVKIDGETRTAADKKKFDLALLSAGTEFDLRFDLSLSDGPDEERQSLLRAFATALDGLGRGEIRLGARKRRGFGHCRVREWRARRYDLCRREHLLAWLAEGRAGEDGPWPEVEAVEETSAPQIAEALKLGPSVLGDARQRFTLRADLALDGSLLVRSGFGEADARASADVVHLHALTVDERGETRPRPLLPGTSWAGALRARPSNRQHSRRRPAGKAPPRAGEEGRCLRRVGLRPRRDKEQRAAP